MVYERFLFCSLSLKEFQYAVIGSAGSVERRNSYYILVGVSMPRVSSAKVMASFVKAHKLK